MHKIKNVYNIIHHKFKENIQTNHYIKQTNQPDMDLETKSNVTYTSKYDALGFLPIK